MPLHNNKAWGTQDDFDMDPWDFGPGSEGGWPGQGADLLAAEIPEEIQSFGLPQDDSTWTEAQLGEHARQQWEIGGAKDWGVPEETQEIGAYPEAPSALPVARVIGDQDPTSVSPPPPPDPTQDQFADVTDIYSGSQRDAFLNVAQDYPNTAAGFDSMLAAALAEGRPWAEVGSSGTIDFGTGQVPVDVMQGYNDPSRGAWQWIQVEPGQPPVPPQPPELPVPPQPPIVPRVETIVPPQPPIGPPTEEEIHVDPLITDEPPLDGIVGTDLPVPLTGDLRTDPSTTDYPYSVPQQQLIGMQQVGADPISELMNAALAATAWGGGMTPTNLAGQTQRALGSIMAAGGQGAEVPSEQGWFAENTLQDLLQSGGRLPLDVQRRAQEMETLRDPIEAFRQAQLAQGQATLASRGLLGQGPELGFMQGLESRLAPMYAGAGQQVALAEAERADQRYQAALGLATQQGQAQAQRREDRLSTTLQLATGMSEEQSRNMLATVQTWTERQQMLANVVAGELDRNALWSQFLADFGLRRDQAMQMIQSNQVALMLPMLQQFLATVQTAASGFAPYDDPAPVRTYATDTGLE